MTDRLSRCDGCDDMQPGVETCRIKVRSTGEWMTCRYCPDCMDLAEMDWNGDTDKVERITVPA